MTENNQYRELAFGTIEEGKKQGVFILVYAPDAKPYKNYDNHHLCHHRFEGSVCKYCGSLDNEQTKLDDQKKREENEKLQQQVIPLVLAQVRWDGRIGFPGGMVDPGETLIEAVCREAAEEICMNVHVERLEPLATFSDEWMNIHSYSYIVTEAEIVQLRNISNLAEHSVAEVGGVVVFQIADFGAEKGYNAILKNNFAATAKLELQKLVSEKGLLN